MVRFRGGDRVQTETTGLEREDRRGKRKRGKTERLQIGPSPPLVGYLSCSLLSSNRTTSHSEPPARDHRHITGFKSRGRASCLAGAWDQSWDSMTESWNNASQITFLSPGGGAEEPTSSFHTGKGDVSVTRVTQLNWFMCGLPKWTFIAFPVIEKFKSSVLWYIKHFCHHMQEWW